MLWKKGAADGRYVFEFNAGETMNKGEYTLIFGNSGGSNGRGTLQYTTINLDKDLSGNVVYDVESWSDSGWDFGQSVAQNQANNPAMLPEPTVLALLALGVAGLALKRKVA